MPQFPYQGERKFSLTFNFLANEVNRKGRTPGWEGAREEEGRGKGVGECECGSAGPGGASASRASPTPKVSQPPLLGPWGTSLSAAEPTAAGRRFLDGGPLASAPVYFWSHS